MKNKQVWERAQVNNYDLLQCPQSDKCVKCPHFKICMELKDNQEKEFHRELITEQHSNG